MSHRSPFTPSGIVARILMWLCKKVPKEARLSVAACYGIVELLGLSALAKPLGGILISTMKDKFNTGRKHARAKS